METVLAIALLQAESDEEHPMHALAANHPDFIVRIRTLASDRGVRAHGARVTLASDTELDSDAFMRAAVSTLLPAVRFDATTAVAAPRLPSRPPVGCPRKPARRLRLPVVRQARPGHPELADRCREVLAGRRGRRRRPRVRPQPLRGTAGSPAWLPRWSSAARTHGATTTRSAPANVPGRPDLVDLPPGIASVNPRRIREALQGRDLSVGASVLALLLTSSEGRLASLADNQPNLPGRRRRDSRDDEGTETSPYPCRRLMRRSFAGPPSLRL